MDKYELAESIKEAIPGDVSDLDVAVTLAYVLDDYLSSMKFDQENSVSAGQ